MNPLWTQWSEASRLFAFIRMRPSRKWACRPARTLPLPPIVFNRNVPSMRLKKILDRGLKLSDIVAATQRELLTIRQLPLEGL